MFDLAEVKFQEALGMAPKEDEASTSGEEGAEEARPELGLKALIQVLWGNVLFERSQVRHHRDDKKWQVDTDAAVAKFNEAGCSKDDITATTRSGRWTRMRRWPSSTRRGAPRMTSPRRQEVAGGHGCGGGQVQRG